MLQENVNSTNNIPALYNFEDLTKDGGILKKIITHGFSKYSPKDGDEVKVHYHSFLENGKSVENTRITNNPQSIILGTCIENKEKADKNIIPGLEIALKHMKMGEHAKLIIKPEYSFAAINKNNSLGENEKLTSDDVCKMDVNTAKLFSTITYEIELIKYDKPRKNKIILQPDERIAEAATLKGEGNDLFKEKRFLEAIIKYEDGWEYLTQMPNEFLTSKVFDLRLQIKLNITNCHLSLHEYNYALKKLEEVLSIKNPLVPKFYYYRAIALMNVGEFEKSEDDINNLNNFLQNDPLVKNLKEDLIKLKEKSLKSKKDLVKRGIFKGNLYEERKNDILSSPKDLLPKLDPKNLNFYVDLIVNNDNKSPQKLKFEIFNENYKTSEDFKQVVNILRNDIKNKSLLTSVTQNELCRKIFIPSNENSENNISNKEKIPIYVLKEFSSPEESQILNNFFSESIPKNDILKSLPPCEEILLLLYREENEDVNKFYLNLSIRKISDFIQPNLFVIGRCFYKTQGFLKLTENIEEMNIKITDSDYSNFL